MVAFTVCSVLLRGKVNKAWGLVEWKGRVALVRLCVPLITPDLITPCSCLRDANIVVVQFEILATNEEHAPYPTGFATAAEVFAGLIAALPAVADVLEPHIGEDFWRIQLQRNQVPQWRETQAFNRCLAVRGPQFIAEIGRGVPQAPRRRRSELDVGWAWPWSGTFEAMSVRSQYWHWLDAP